MGRIEEGGRSGGKGRCQAPKYFDIEPPVSLLCLQTGAAASGAVRTTNRKSSLSAGSRHRADATTTTGSSRGRGRRPRDPAGAALPAGRDVIAGISV